MYFLMYENKLKLGINANKWELIRKNNKNKQFNEVEKIDL